MADVCKRDIKRNWKKQVLKNSCQDNMSDPYLPNSRWKMGCFMVIIKVF